MKNELIVFLFDIFPALNEIFTLDAFVISQIPVAIRSFIHHFYPAYGFPLVDFATRVKNPQYAEGLSRLNAESGSRETRQKEESDEGESVIVPAKKTERRFGVDWAEAAAQLVLGGSVNQKSK